MIINTFIGYLLLNTGFIIVGLSESRAFIQWGMLELTILRVLPLLVRAGNSSKIQAGVKYFLRQAPASVWIFGSLILFNRPLASAALTPAIFYKLGLPPFHGWLFSLSASIDFKELVILLTFQKILPLNILESVFRVSLICVSTVIRIFLIVAACNSISSIKPVLLLSSISATYWPLSCLYAGGEWLEFIISYSIIFFAFTFTIFHEKLNSYSSLVKSRFNTRLFCVSHLLNLGGIPPFLGFFLKVMVLKTIVKGRGGLSILLIILSFTILYVYIQIIIPLLVFNIKIINNNFNSIRAAIYALTPFAAVLLFL